MCGGDTENLGARNPEPVCIVTRDGRMGWGQGCSGKPNTTGFSPTITGVGRHTVYVLCLPLRPISKIHFPSGNCNDGQ